MKELPFEEEEVMEVLETRKSLLMEHEALKGLS